MHDKKSKNEWCEWGSNPRPFGLAPKASALDHSAITPFITNLPVLAPQKETILIHYVLC